MDNILNELSELKIEEPILPILPIFHKGYIVISEEFYQNSWSYLYPIFKDFRPLYIEHKPWLNDRRHLYGDSPLFDKLLEGEEIPEYSILFTMLVGPELTYEFKRVVKN